MDAFSAVMKILQKEKELYISSKITGPNIPLIALCALESKIKESLALNVIKKEKSWQN